MLHARKIGKEGKIGMLHARGMSDRVRNGCYRRQIGSDWDLTRKKDGRKGPKLM